MKSIHLFYSTCIGLLFLIASCTASGDRVVGHWLGEDGQRAIVFFDDGRYVAHQAFSSDSVNAEQSKKWEIFDNGTFTMNYARNPAWIDVISLKNRTTKRWEGIVEFVDDNNIKIAMDEIRPKKIENAGSVLVFKRVSEKELNLEH